VSIEGIALGEGGTIYLYLNAYYTMPQTRDLYRVRLSLPDLAPQGRPEKVSEVCLDCLAQSYPGQVLITTLGNPLARVLSPDRDERRWVSFVNLFLGSTGNRLHLQWGNSGVLPRYYPFGEGWMASLIEPYRVWVRQGDEWELVAERRFWPYEPLVVRYDSYGRWEKVVRLPQGWRLGASLSPDYALVFSTEGEYGVLRRDGTVLFLRESEKGLAPFGPSPEVAERIAGLAEPVPAGLFRLREEVVLTSRGQEGSSYYYLEMLAGTERFAVLARGHQGSPRWELVTLDDEGKILWRRSFNPQEINKAISPPEEWPEDVRRYPSLSTGGAFLGGDAYFALSLRGKRYGPYLPEEGRSSVKETYLGAGVVRLRADGGAELVAHLNLGESLRKAGIELPSAYLESRGRLIEIKEGFGPSFFHLALMPRADGKSLLVRFTLTVRDEGPTTGSTKQKLRERLRGIPAGGSFPFSATVACALEVESGKITDCIRYEENSESSQLIPPIVTPDLGLVVMGTRLSHTVLIQGKVDYRGSGLGRPIPLGLGQGPSLYGYSEEGFVGNIRFSPTVQMPDKQLYPRDNLPYSWEDLCRWRPDGTIDVCAALPRNVGLLGLVPTDPPWLAFIVVPEETAGIRPDHLLVSPTGKVLKLEVVGESLSITQVEAPPLVETTRLILGRERWLPVDPQITG